MNSPQLNARDCSNGDYSPRVLDLCSELEELIKKNGKVDCFVTIRDGECRIKPKTEIEGEQYMDYLFARREIIGRVNLPIVQG